MCIYAENISSSHDLVIVTYCLSQNATDIGIVVLLLVSIFV